MKYRHEYTIILESNSPGVLYDEKLLDELSRLGFKLKHHSIESLDKDNNKKGISNYFLKKFLKKR